jgi:hypothetical protein
MCHRLRRQQTGQGGDASRRTGGDVYLHLPLPISAERRNLRPLATRLRTAEPEPVAERVTKRITDINTAACGDVRLGDDPFHDAVYEARHVFSFLPHSKYGSNEPFMRDPV